MSQTTTPETRPEEAPAPAAPAKATSAVARWTNVLVSARRQGLLLVLVLLCVTFSFASPYFLTQSNLINIGGLSAALGIMALAQTFLVIAGGIDVSVGSVVSVSGVLTGVLYTEGLNLWVAALIGLLAGAAVGAVNGLLVVRLQIDPLVASLGTYSVAGGLAYMLSGAQTLFLGDTSFNYLGTGKILGLPFQFLLLVALFGLFLFIERKTPFGRIMYATGGNLEAARLAGLRVDLLRFGLYVISGLSAAVAGMILTAQLSTASPQVGAPYLLSVVTAVILGGASLAGGRGSVFGTLVAVVILGVLQNGFALLGVNSFAQQVALGVLLIFAVLLDQLSKKQHA